MPRKNELPHRKKAAELIDFDALLGCASPSTERGSHIIDISAYSKPQKFPYSLHIDWLSFTYDFCTLNSTNYHPDEESILWLNELIDILFPGKQFKDFELMKARRQNYEKVLVINENTKIFLFGPECLNGNKSLMLDITGDGVKRLSVTQIYNLYKWSDNPYHFAKITRSDPRMDNHTNLCRIEVLHALMKQGLFECGSREKIYYSPTTKSITIYFGKDSDFCLKIYEKNAERTEKDPNFIQQDEYWTRFEFRIRDEVRNRQFAYMYMRAYEKGDMGIFARYFVDVLAGFVTFYEWKNRKKEEKVIFKEWEQLLEGYSGVKQLCKQKSSLSFDKKVDWINRSVFGALSMVYIVYGKDIFEKWLYRGIGLNLQNYDDLQRAIVNSKNEELGVLQFSNVYFTDEGKKLTDKFEDLEGTLQAFIKKEWKDIE